MAATKNEVATQGSFSTGLRTTLESNKDALPKDLNIARFVQNGLALLNGNETLAKYAREHGTAQIKQGMLRAAILNLDFMSKECYLIPFGSNINFMLDYRGCKKLAKMYSVRKIKDIIADVVREGDVFESGIERNEPYVNFKPQAFSNKPIIGAFAQVLFVDGGSLAETMSKAEIDVCKSKSKQQNSMPWKDFYSEMAKKTVLHRVFKRIELNFENVQQQIAYDEDMEIETDTEKIVEAEIAENANQIPFEPEDVIDEPSESGQTELPDFMKSE